MTVADSSSNGPERAQLRRFVIFVDSFFHTHVYIFKFFGAAIEKCKFDLNFGSFKKQQQKKTSRN